MKLAAGILSALVASTSAEVYFKETFDDATWEDRWVVSDWKKSELGKWKHTAGDYYGDAEADKGIQTSQDARFYSISAKLPAEFSNKDKDLVIQYSVKQTKDVDCQGAYIKLLPAGLDQKNFGGDSDYNIMFGPDVCGSTTKRVHQIFTYKGENLLTEKNTKCATDKQTHVYTFIVKPDNTYETRIDGEVKESGNMKDDWKFLLPKEIKDPEQSKPKDWVDDKMIADPEDVKPEGYDDIPATIADPDAEKPDDWDDDADGEWEAPTIDNPEYKGEWEPKMIENPDYKGEWVHPMIPNPDFVDDNEVYKYDSNAYVGFELWQVKSGTIFDNIIITDDIAEAESFMAETWGKNKDAEKKMLDDIEEAERKKAEEERKAAEAAAAEEDDDEDDEDEEEEDDDEEEEGHKEL